MIKRFRSTFPIALMAGLALTGSAQSRTLDFPETPLPINVRVYNYAEVTDGVLARALKEAGRVFRRSGIETNWVGCSVPGHEVETEPSCNTTPAATDIQIRILPREMATKLMKHYSEFGLAFTAAGDGFGSNASIFYHRVEELSARRHTSEALLLGHLIAHEVGHLLLGSNSHSRSGIMHVPWDESQVERALLGTLLFTKQEAHRMRKQVSRRIRSVGI